MTKWLKNIEIHIYLVMVFMLSISTIFAQTNFDLLHKNGTKIYYQGNTPVIKNAVDMLLEDSKKVASTPFERTNTIGANTVVVYNIDEESPSSNRLIKQYNLDTTGVKGKWEAFKYQVVRTQTGEPVLAVLGSDKRGTAFGLLELSRKMGVSPWVWWADVTPNRREKLVINDTEVHQPDVKYRGIFLNDEDWGLRPWASKTFEPEVGNIGPKTYSKIFELLLRLKANTLWPAMHPGTKAFFQMKGNREMAEEYAISIGSSHAEPMLRNNVGEWDSDKMGAFNYMTNKDTVYKYWDTRVQEASAGDNIYTLGMRGIHDGQMQGTSSTEEVVEVMSGVFKDQRGMLKKHVDKKVENIPQAFVPYKEVLEIYDNGLEVPKDVTLVWPDDNYGYIRRLSNAKERQRKGGAGVYYHISYWGQPHDYLWLSTTQPGLIWEEMTKAWRYGAKNMWIVNVGDIKPAAYNTQLFLEMAWDINSIHPNDLKQYMENWYSAIFSDENGKVIADVMEEYYRLASIRKPEFMGWSQTEPITDVSDTEFNSFVRGDEINKRLHAYRQLVNKINGIEKEITKEQKNAFFELVSYPVKAATALNEKILFTQKSKLLNKYGLHAANTYADSAKAAYAKIKKLTDTYNNDLADGKWKYMMDMAPRGLPVFDAPKISKEFPSYFDGVIIWLEGEQKPYDSNNKLPKFNPYSARSHFIQMFLKGAHEVSWKVDTEDQWIKFNETSGKFKDEYRLDISIDWDKVPKNTRSGSIQLNVGKENFTIEVPLEEDITNFPDEQPAIVEQNGKVFLQAGDFVEKKDLSTDYKWDYIGQLGYSNRAYTLLPVPVDYKGEMDKAYLEYRFYTYSKGPVEVSLYTIPTHPVNNSSDVRVAIAVNGERQEGVSFKEEGRTGQWKQNVLRNHALTKFEFDFKETGWQTIRIYPLDPGVILDQIMVDFKPDQQIYELPFSPSRR